MQHDADYCHSYLRHAMPCEATGEKCEAPNLQAEIVGLNPIFHKLFFSPCTFLHWILLEVVLINVHEMTICFHVQLQSYSFNLTGPFSMSIVPVYNPRSGNYL